jgi:hypothetical protein
MDDTLVVVLGFPSDYYVERSIRKSLWHQWNQPQSVVTQGVSVKIDSATPLVSVLRLLEFLFYYVYPCCTLLVA